MFYKIGMNRITNSVKKRDARPPPALVKLTLSGWIILRLCGCATGPDFEMPPAPEVSTYTESPLPAQTVSSEYAKGDAQTFLMAGDLPAEWWKLFQSDSLNQLVSLALKNNPDLQAAKAALRQSRELLYVEEGSLTPAVDMRADITRSKFSGAAFGQPDFPSTLFTLHNASVNVSYDLDLFGAKDRAVEALMAGVERQAFEVEAAFLALTANLVTSAVREAGLREQIKHTETLAAFETERYRLMERELSIGETAESAVLIQKTRLAEIQAMIPPLRKQLAHTRNQLTALVGQTPGEKLAASFDLSSLHLPEELPVSLPSKLVHQRPDIKIAQARLHAASAEVGVAMANQLPQFTITGGYGSLSTRISDLFSPDTNIWNIGAGLTDPIFRGGKLKHKRQAAIAAFDRAAADYRGTVLHAFQNVADSLEALRHDADTLAAQATAHQAATQSMNLTEKRYELGAVGYLTLLDARRSYHQTNLALVDAQAIRIADTAALFQALGGGWWNREQLETSPLKSE